MKKEKNDIEATSGLIRTAFDLSGPEWEQPIIDREELIRQLIPILDNLLNQHMEKLLLILYRIDVNEFQVKKVLSEEDPGKISTSLANLIIDRQLLKIAYRKKYR